VTQQMEKNQPRRMSERASRQPPGPVSYWLIAEKRNNWLEVLTIRTDHDQETLPVFSSEEEAEIILRFRGVTGGWRAKESSAGELVSVRSGPCAGVEKVALDPSPEMIVEGTVRLVSLLRESFMNLITAKRYGPLAPGSQRSEAAQINPSSVSLPAPRQPQIRPGHLSRSYPESFAPRTFVTRQNGP
jgi:hypothetical protein